MGKKSSLVSVIIPVFNREKYLSECLDSVLASTFSNLEIIVINDGSTDNSLAICNEYAKRDRRIVVISKENEGAGLARNVGLERATGDYFFFVDSDDLIDTSSIEKAVSLIRETDCDLVITNFQCIDSNGVFINKDIESSIVGHIEIWDEFDYWEHCYSGDLVWCIMPGGKLYKKKIFDSIRYKKMFYEDEMIAPDLISKVSKIAVVNEKLYFYRIHDENTMGNSNGFRYLDKVKAFQYRANKFLNEHNRHLGESLLWMMNSICYLQKFQKDLGSSLLLENYLITKDIVQKSRSGGVEIKLYIKKRMQAFLVSLRKYERKYLSNEGALKYRLLNIIRILLSKFKRFVQIKIALKKAKLFLEDGIYSVKDRYFVKAQEDKRVFLKTFNINSKRKLLDPVSSLYFVVTRYKIICITKQKAFFYYKSKKRYLSSKKTYEQYEKLLPYSHPSILFNDENKMSISDVVLGIKYKNHELFDEVLGFLFDVCLSCVTTNKIISSFDPHCLFPFSVQHGDFKDSNIIWHGDTFSVIDLETVDYYPIFFDLLFYVLISKTKDSGKLLLDGDFISKIKNVFLLKTTIVLDCDYKYVDFALSRYLLFLLEKYKKEHTYGFFDYYLYWTIFPFIQDDHFEGTKSIINDYLSKDKYYILKGRKVYDTM